MGLADICVRFVGAERENNRCTTNLWQPAFARSGLTPGWTGDRKLGKQSLRSIAVSSTRTNRQEFAYPRTSYPWSSVAVDHIQGSVTGFTSTHSAAQRKRAHGKRPHGRLITTARLLFFETTFVACCKVRKRNWLMAMKTGNSAILLFRFNYHFLPFYYLASGKWMETEG